MGNLKNTARSKRKYDSREGITARNKEQKQIRHEVRMETLKDRTRFLKGNPVKYFGQKVIVEDVFFSGDEGYPENARRSGAFLSINLGTTNKLVSRSSVKPIPVI